MHSIDIILRILGMVIAISIPVLSFLLNRKLNRDKKDITEVLGAKLGIVNERMQTQESTLVRVESLLMQHLTEDDLRQTYRNTVKKVLERNIDTPLLKQSYKNILSYYADSVLNLVFNYIYFIEKRKESSREREKYVQREKQTLIDELNQYIHTYMDSMKEHKGKKVSFTQFLEDLKIYNGLELLCSRLVENGFDQKEAQTDLKNTMSNTLDKFCEQFISATVIWENKTTLSKPIEYD